MSIYDNELLIDVQTLNIDSASYTQIKSACNGDDKMKEMILSIVEKEVKCKILLPDRVVCSSER